jgi:SpoIID/LytB domain protein
VYAGYDKELEGAGWVRAVKATSGQVVLYKGSVATAVYSSSSGGYTESNENVWGGTPIPWLRGVCDPGDYTAANPSRTWKVARTAAEVTSALRAFTGDIGTVERFTNADRGVSGRIIAVRVQGSTGGHTITGAELRAGLGLRDDRVWFNEDLNVEGPIRDLYDRVECRPGLAASKAFSVSGGSWQAFDDGAIYRNDGADLTAWLRGALEDRYAAEGGPRGHLGLPTSKMQEAADGSTSASFEHGAIACDAGGACTVT